MVYYWNLWQWNAKENCKYKPIHRNKCTTHWSCCLNMCLFYKQPGQLGHIEKKYTIRKDYLEFWLEDVLGCILLNIVLSWQCVMQPVVTLPVINISPLFKACSICSPAASATWQLKLGHLDNTIECWVTGRRAQGEGLDLISSVGVKEKHNTTTGQGN